MAAKHPRSPPFDPESALGFLLYKAHQRTAGAFRRVLEPRGLTPPQFALLALLQARDGQTQADLAQRAATDPNTLVGLLDRLEAAGLVQRTPAPQDRRAKVIRITPAGRATFAKCLPLQRRIARRVWSALTPPEQNQLRQLLEKLLRFLEQRRGL